MTILSQEGPFRILSGKKWILVLMAAWLLVKVCPASALEAPGTALRFVGRDFGTPMVEEAVAREMEARFRERFFSPWNRDRIEVQPEDSLWAWDQWKENEPWGENLRPHSREWMDSLLDNCSMESWGSVNR
ncbi:MAG: NLP/P60 protein, partial [Synergistales bacterium 58_81]